MKKHMIAIAVIAALAIGIVGGQGSVYAASDSSTIYIVEPGDTLWAIAKDHNVTVEDLLTWNELDSTIIQPLQELKIGKEVEIEKEVDKHIVKKGDTLFEIAEEYDMSLEDLMTLNKISGHLIFPGDELVLNDLNDFLFGPNADLDPALAQVMGHLPILVKKEPEIPVVAKAQPTKTPTSTVAATTKTPTSTSSSSTGSPKATAPPPTTGKEMTVTATAYTAYCEGCSGITYTGIDLRSNPNQRVIAVDPNVIPLGKRVWVEGYGEAIAGDIGGAIKGNIIDVFLEHKQDALNWGRKTVKIRILD